MKRIFLSFMLMVIAGQFVFSQTTGDYRSNAVAANWNVASTWERFDGTNWVVAGIPSSTDGVITIRSGHTITTNSSLTADQVIIETGGALSITSNIFTLANGTGDDLVVNGALNITGGSLTQPGTVLINSTFNWNGGVLSAATVNSPGGTIILGTATSKSLNGTLLNNGTITWNDGLWNFTNGTLTNNGSIDHTGNDQTNSISGTNSIVNNGSYEKSNASNVIFGIPFTNAGTFDITAGGLSTNATFANSGTMNLNGTGTFTSGAVFTNTGNIILAGGFSILSNSTFNHNGASQITGTGNFTTSSGMNLNANLIVPASIVFNQTNGTITGPGNLEVNNDFTFNGITGTGTLTINGNSTWEGGNLGRNLTIGSTRTLTLSGAASKAIAGATLTNQGTINWSDGILSFNSGTLTNNGTINHTGNDQTNNIGGTNSFVNNGTYVKSNASLITFNIPFTNAGTFDVTAGGLTTNATFANSGTMNLNGTGTLTSGGAWTNTGNLVLVGGFSIVSNSTFNHNGSSQITGTGNFTTTSIMNLNANLIVPASIVFNQTNGTISGPGNLEVNNDFTFNGITGTGTLTINGNSTWEGGTLARNLTIPSGRTLTLTGTASKAIQSATLTNQGTIDWIDGAVSFNNGTLTSSGTINHTGNDQTANIGGVNSFVNNGTYTKSNAANVVFNIPFTNAGTFDLTAGGLSTNASFTNSGTMNLNGTGTLTSGGTWTNSGNLTFIGGFIFQSNSTFNHNAGSQISGTGSFTTSSTMNLNVNLVVPVSILFSQPSGTITGAGDLEVNNDFTFNAITGSGLLTINGNSTWESGQLGRNLVIGSAGSLTLTGAGGKTIQGITVTINGTMNWNDGSLNFNGGTLINNGTILHPGNDGTANLGGTNSFVNNGTYTKSNATDITYNTPIINSATFNVTAGGALNNAGFNNSGTVNLSGTGTLTSGGTWTNTGNIVLSGGFTFSSISTFNHNGASQISGTGIFNSLSTMNLNANLLFPSTIVFNQPGGTITGAGNLEVNNDFTFNNITGTGTLTINGNSTWEGGSLARQLTIPVSRTLTLTTGSTKILTGPGMTLTVNGTLQFNDGSLGFGGAILTNNGTFNHAGDDDFFLSSGTNSFINAGSYTKTHTSVVTLNISTTNSGAFNVNAGNYTFLSSFSNSGTVNLSTAGTISINNTWTNTGTLNLSGPTLLSSGTFNHNGSSQILGTATFTTSGTMNLGANLIVPSSIIFNQASGTITGAGNLEVNNDFSFMSVTGTGTFIVNGNSTWNGGTLGRNYTVDASRTLTVTSGTTKTLSDNVLTLNGDMVWNAGNISLANASFINNGDVNSIGNLGMSVQSGTTSLTNNGKFIMNGPGTLIISVPVTNSASGEFSGTGTIQFGSSLTNNGSIAPGNPIGILTVNGAQPFSANSSLAIELLNNSGAGTGHDQMTRNSNLTLAGTLNVTESASVPDGSYTIISLSAGVISGNFTTVILPPDYTVVVNATTVVLNVGVALPVTLISFNGRYENNGVKLSWKTSQELNTSHFEIERSADGRTYSSIGNVQASGTSTTTRTYSFFDGQPLAGPGYYRLRIVDFGGEEEFSPVVRINRNKIDVLEVFPNPAWNMITVTGIDYQHLEIFNIEGKLVKRFNVSANRQYNVEDLSSGIYILKILNEGEITSMKLLKR